MPMGNSGGLFIGALKPQDKAFLKPLLVNARKNGYTHFVEPCAGAMAMSYLAAECGYLPSEIDASDISFFSGAFARGINGETTEGMGLKVEGFTDEEVKDPATALYAQMYLRMAQRSGREYYYQLLQDLKLRREQHIESIREQIDYVGKRIKGYRYRDLCMWKHMREVLDDEKAIVVCCPPTYTSGYEKFFDTGGKLTWNEPEFEVFDSETGLFDLKEMIKDAKALFIIYEERPAGKSASTPVYGRDAGRPGMYMYLTSNRPDEAEALAKGKEINRKNGSKMSPIKGARILPVDYVITEKCEISIAPILPENATYYRKLWTHNFSGGASGSCMGLFLDGYLAGVFGYDKIGIALGGKNDVFFSFGICAPSKHRLNRILYKVACTRQALAFVLDDIQKVSVIGVKTQMITKYPESKEMRGIMKLVERVKDKEHGYRLWYRCDITNLKFDEIMREWVKKEEAWEKNRKELGMSSKN